MVVVALVFLIFFLTTYLKKERVVGLPFGSGTEGDSIWFDPELEYRIPVTINGVSDSSIGINLNLNIRDKINYQPLDYSSTRVIEVDSNGDVIGETSTLQVRRFDIESLHTNLNFEEIGPTGSPSSWRVSALPSGGLASVEENNCFQGNCIKIFIPEDAPMDYYFLEHDLVAVKPNTIYEVSAHIKTNISSENYRAFLSGFVLSGTEEGHTVYNMIDEIRGERDWSLIKFRFKTDSVADGLRIVVTLNGRGEAWFDELHINQITPDWVYTGGFGEHYYYLYINPDAGSENLPQLTDQNLLPELSSVIGEPQWNGGTTSFLLQNNSDIWFSSVPLKISKENFE